MGEPSSPTRPTGGTTRGLATVTRGLGGRAPGSLAPSVPPGARPWLSVLSVLSVPALSTHNHTPVLAMPTILTQTRSRTSARRRGVYEEPV